MLAIVTRGDVSMDVVVDDTVATYSARVPQVSLVYFSAIAFSNCWYCRTATRYDSIKRHG